MPNDGYLTEKRINRHPSRGPEIVRVDRRGRQDIFVGNLHEAARDRGKIQGRRKWGKNIQDRGKKFSGRGSDHEEH